MGVTPVVYFNAVLLVTKASFASESISDINLHPQKAFMQNLRWIGLQLDM